MLYFILFTIVVAITIAIERVKPRNLEDNFLLKIVAILIGIFGGFSDKK